MMIHPSRNALTALLIAVTFLLIIQSGVATAGMLRINLTNGTALEVPYYWEENGEIKFDMPGGTAGIPKAYVKSVQEIVTMREFDPEYMIASSDLNADNQRKKTLQELATKDALSKLNVKLITPEKTEEVLKTANLFEKKAPASAEHLFGPSFANQGDFTEIARIEGNGLMLVMQNILSSRTDLQTRRFYLTLYDSEGRVLQRQPCQVFKIETDPKTMKQLGLRGQLYSVVATVKPDRRISSYEISTLHSY